MSDEVPTSERLARDLEAAGAPVHLVERARAKEYDDFESPHAMPHRKLYSDLKRAGLDTLAKDVARGRWDGSKAEADAWAASEDGRSTFAAFGMKPPEGT